MKNKRESFIDEEFLRQLENLKVLANRGIRSVERGEHTSWRSGPSLEFLDYRKYQMGDDFRYVDWNVYGRLDKLFIKLFRAEVNQQIHILIDSSGSMSDGKPPKDLYAKKIASAISYISLANLDNVTITAFNNALKDSMTPVRSRLSYSKVLNYLQNIRSHGETDFSRCLLRYAGSGRRPGIAIILSDIMDSKGFKEGLEALRNSRFDAAMIQILNHQEVYPSAMGNLLLKEVETGETKSITVDRTVLDIYHRKIKDYIKRIRNFCMDLGMDYFLCDTGLPFEDQLLDYLTSGKLFR